MGWSTVPTLIWCFNSGEGPTRNLCWATSMLTGSLTPTTLLSSSVTGREILAGAFSGAELLVWSQIGKPWYLLAVNHDRFYKHRYGTYPKLAFPVFRSVDNKLFLGFTVRGHPQYGVLVSFVVPITSGRNMHVCRVRSLPLACNRFPSRPNVPPSQY